MPVAVVRFHDLHPVLPPQYRPSNSNQIARFDFSFNEPPSVKHAIEIYMVPHTEVDLLLINGNPQPWSALVNDNDQIDAYPSGYPHPLSNLSRVRPHPLPEPRFLLDGHLGRLAVYLRVLGCDTVYHRQADDPDLAAESEASGRILLTMDRGLLMRSQVTRGCLVLSPHPRLQLAQVARRYHLTPGAGLLTRCLRCNHVLQPVAKSEVYHRIPPKTRLWCDHYQYCPACDQIYWKGSHYDRLMGLINALDMS